MLDAVRDLPLPVVAWREATTPEGVGFSVTCIGGSTGRVRVRQVVLAEALTIGGADAEALLALTRQQIVEVFRASHPEHLPRGVA